MQSNLECLLDYTTPSIPSQFLSKSEMRKLNRLWNPLDREKVEYFSLSDLWNTYDEWSAYGAGVPIHLANGQKLVQYYVPYLSAIQIFTSNSSINYSREEAESACETRDSCSDSLSDEIESVSEKLLTWDGCSSEEGVLEQDSFWHPNDRLGYLNFEYIDKSSPYGRVPLMAKIRGLGRRYPGLMSLRSVDLSPASWMAVAWYPIYHIPTGRSHKDLSTCFLTFHTLSSTFQDMELEDDPLSTERKKRKEGERISLPPFGLASYKMFGDVWVSDKNGRDQERLVSLFNIADSWLKQLSVDHHDFKYFARSG
ncbi:Hypothetical predicted protein [Olea europaea subsp. europaea]|uniref:Uncharacterized protein n=1 Tax=Olea europaea subsp. europaea TaxID=158383 RepID=A0A8S0TV18_OLEEU|nr:Hypothetical predicted protein [Olea europaea subsp. europaea]